MLIIWPDFFKKSKISSDFRLRFDSNSKKVPGDVGDYNFVNRISPYPIKGDKAQINHQRYLFELHQLFFGVLNIVCNITLLRNR